MHRTCPGYEQNKYMSSVLEFAFLFERKCAFEVELSSIELFSVLVFYRFTRLHREKEGFIYALMKSSESLSTGNLEKLDAFETVSMIL